MRHVKQRNGVDCGLAVAAMLANTSYDQAADVDPNPDSPQGMSVSDLQWTLIGLTGKEWSTSKAGNGKRLCDYPLPTKTIAVLIRHHGKSFGHWVAWDGEKVFDPEEDSSLSTPLYRRREWEIIRVLLIR